ncbi:Zn-ribbon domain-containing OB-fold protein [Anaerobacillus sp. MEB173]|uniref:Zn-ribbon domain-containing OB-fold protein n=1 Tax=Anaerobacillus sp. MEB173 TaxID=3383345 RepID=UPI003F90F296
MNSDNQLLLQQVKGNVSKKYWDNLKEEKFMFQKCKDCGFSIFYPRVVCPKCMSENLSWHQAKGNGQIYSYTVVYRTGDPIFKSETPYVVGLIELAEGIRVMGIIIGWDDPEALQIEQGVSIVYDKVTDDVTLPRFKINREGVV